MIKSIAFSFAATFLCVGLALAAPINQVTPGSLTGTTGLITFEDVPGGASPGTNYDGILAFVNGASFAERFVGQSLIHSGGDILGGTPDSPLSLQVGDPSQNLNVFLYNNNSNVLDGLGKAPEDSPAAKTIGEGSFAVLFQYDQSAFGFDLVGGNIGEAHVSFFTRNGTLIEAITLTGLSNHSYAFTRDGGYRDIAGISIDNNDPAGIAIDNLRFTGPVSAVPEPSTSLLLIAGLVGAGLLRKRIRA